jgi:hypothetical protein
MKHRLCVSLAAMLALAAGLAATAADAQPTIVSSTEHQTGPLTRTEWIVQAGPSPLDGFRMTRLRRAAGPARAAVLLLPALGTHFALYEQQDAHGGIGSSLAGGLALRGYDVWGYSPRFEGIPAGTCEAGLFDCSVMAGWDLNSMLGDISFVRDQIELASPGIGVAAGGLSLGGILAVAVANADGARYDGVLVWEGMLFSADPAVTALNSGYCAGVEAQLAAGIVYDGVGGNVLRIVVQASTTAPDGPTVSPLFPPIFTNHNALVASLAVPAPGPVSMPVPDYIFAAGSLAEDRLFFASEARLAENVLTAFNAYSPVALVRDISCSLAGIDTTHTANLGAFTGSLLVIGGGRGFGGYIQDQADAFTGAAERIVRIEPGFGHIDHIFNPRHHKFVEQPILRWLNSLF